MDIDFQKYCYSGLFVAIILCSADSISTSFEKNIEAFRNLFSEMENYKKFIKNRYDYDIDINNFHFVEKDKSPFIESIDQQIDYHIIHTSSLKHSMSGGILYKNRVFKYYHVNCGLGNEYHKPYSVACFNIPVKVGTWMDQLNEGTLDGITITDINIFLSNLWLNKIAYGNINYFNYIVLGSLGQPELHKDVVDTLTGNKDYYKSNTIFNYLEPKNSYITQYQSSAMF